MPSGGSLGVSASLRAPRAFLARSQRSAPRGSRELRAVVEVRAEGRVRTDRPEGQHATQAVRRLRGHAARAAYARLPDQRACQARTSRQLSPSVWRWTLPVHASHRGSSVNRRWLIDGTVVFCGHAGRIGRTWGTPCLRCEWKRQHGARFAAHHVPRWQRPKTHVAHEEMDA